MVKLSTIIELYRHMEWADAAVWNSALASASARQDAKLRDYFYHLHMVQHAFIRIWRGEPFDTPFPAFEELASMLSWARGYYPDLFAFADNLKDENMLAPMPMPWADRISKRLGRSPEVTTIGETALQVALHSQYHRGQIGARLRDCGAEPPLVDYIAWVWTARPAPCWPKETASSGVSAAHVPDPG
jgi:uncharacterized damage-inducible protein DinB